MKLLDSDGLIYYSPDESGGGAGAGGQSGDGAGSPPPPPPEGEKPEGTTDDAPDLADLIKGDPAKAASEIKRLRQEAKDAREAVKEHKKKLDTYAEAEKKLLQDQGDFKKLYEQAQPELERYKSEEEMYKRYKDAFQEMYKARVKTVPKHILELMEGMDPLQAMQWMARNEDKLKPPTEVDLDAGKKDKRKNDTLGSPEHLAAAARRLRIALPFSSAKPEERK